MKVDITSRHQPSLLNHWDLSEISYERKGSKKINTFFIVKVLPKSNTSRIPTWKRK